jgi:hypothetical protein
MNEVQHMATLKNLDRRLITINHSGKRYDIKCGENPSVEVPDEAMKTDFVKHLVKTGKLAVIAQNDSPADDTTPPPADDTEVQRAEFNEMTVDELCEHCKLLDLSGYSNLKKSELIEFILANS